MRNLCIFVSSRSCPNRQNRGFCGRESDRGGPGPWGTVGTVGDRVAPYCFSHNTCCLWVFFSPGPEHRQGQCWKMTLHTPSCNRSRYCYCYYCCTPLYGIYTLTSEEQYFNMKKLWKLWFLLVFDDCMKKNVKNYEQTRLGRSYSWLGNNKAPKTGENNRLGRSHPWLFKSKPDFVERKNKLFLPYVGEMLS